MKIRVVSIGGNDISPGTVDHEPDYYEQLTKSAQTCRTLADIISSDPSISYVIGHGNGPQSGSIQAAFDTASELGRVYSVPLYAAGAMSQGLIGDWLVMGLYNFLPDRNIAGILTHVVVDPEDPAFQNPTKPIGKTYSLEELSSLFPDQAKDDKMLHLQSNGQMYTYKYIAGKGGYRRVVASPRPVEILELSTVIAALDAGQIAITVGGGGIPITRKEKLQGIDAVIDKDYASSLLARNLNQHYADAEVELIILTNEQGAFLDYGTDAQRLLEDITAQEAEQYMPHFAEGSMLPKVKAAVEAVNAGVSKVIITQADYLERALHGQAGTIIYNELPSSPRRGFLANSD